MELFSSTRESPLHAMLVWLASIVAVPPSGLRCGRLADDKKHWVYRPVVDRHSSRRVVVTPHQRRQIRAINWVLPACCAKLVASRAHAVDSRQGTGTDLPACQKRMQQDLTTERAVFQQCSCGLVVSTGQVCGQRLWPALARYATPLNPSVLVLASSINARRNTLTQVYLEQQSLMNCRSSHRHSSQCMLATAVWTRLCLIKLTTSVVRPC
jgi:hypothetical protein